MGFSYINQYFDQVYVVNLKKRPDRKLAMLQKLRRLRIQATFIEAIDGYSQQNEEEFQHYFQQPLYQERCHPLEWKRKRKLLTSSGAWGNLKTFFSIIQDAKRHSYERILCFEDDAVFHKDFENRFKQAISHIPADWKLLYLGATQHAWNIPLELRYPNHFKTEYDPHEPFYYPVRTDGAFALGLHRSVFDLIAVEALAMDCPFDSGPLQEVIKAHPNKCFVLNPNLVIADVTESDIRVGKNQYEFAKKSKWDVEDYEFPFKQDLISVIMPSYNADKTIEEAIRSILAQDYKNLELIVVNDASTDETVAVVRAMMQEDTRVRLITLEQHRGGGAAKNEGLKAAKGDTITFQHAYEISLQTRLTKQLIPIYEKGMLFTVCLSSRSRRRMEKLDLHAEYLDEQVDLALPELGTLVFHRSVFRDYGIFEAFHYAEEVEFVERLLFHKTFTEFTSEYNVHSLIGEIEAISKVFERIDESLYISPDRKKGSFNNQMLQTPQERSQHEVAFRKKYKVNGLNPFPKLDSSEQDRNRVDPIFYPTLSLEIFSVNPEWRFMAPSRLEEGPEKELVKAKSELVNANSKLLNVHNSLSWKVTIPLRKALDLGLFALDSFKKKSKMKVVYFYHIPKNGGTYMLSLLKQFQEATGGDFQSFNNLTQDKTIPKLDENIKQFIESLKDLPAEKVMLIHHHHGYPGMMELHDLLENAREAVHKRGGQMIIFAIVRKPLPFSISLLNYTNRTTEENLTFQDVINKKEEHNHLSKYVLYNHPDRWDHSKMQISEAEIDKHIQLFDYFFPLEKMQDLTALLNGFLGTKRVTIQKKINETEWKLLPTKEEEGKIIAVNKLDQYLYDQAIENAAVNTPKAKFSINTLKNSFLKLFNL